MLKTHKEAREDLPQTRFHEFQSAYKKDSKMIFWFCEGKDDILFYRGPIRNVLKEGWDDQPWDVGGIDNVLALYNKFDWRTYNKKQIIFFIDRDLTEFTGVTLPNKENIYITDNYSIENDAVNNNTCERVLTEILGFNSLTIEEKKQIKRLFDHELTKFIEKMIPVMSWIVHWHSNGCKACLNDIYMKHLFRIKDGVLEKRPHPKQHQDISEYIHAQCKVPVDINYEPTKGSFEFYRKNRHRKFIRGKYLLWFFTEFCLSIHRDCLQMQIIRITSQPKNSTNFSHSNAISNISSRFKIPNTLKEMLKKSVRCYVAQIEAS